MHQSYAVTDSQAAFRGEVRRCFEERQRSLGLSDRQIAASFGLFGRLGARLALERFHRDGTLNDAFRVRLQARLGISDAEFALLSDGFARKAVADRNCFFENFGVFWHNRARIITTKSWSDVTFMGLEVNCRGFERAFPLTLGELLSYYDRGLWSLKTAKGETALIYALSGELSAGTLRADAVVPQTGALVHAQLRSAQAILGPYLDYRPQEKFTPSCWTVRSLARVLSTDFRMKF
ncbi:MAG: hypothetical protein SPL30_09115 [Succinivibrio sp.]|jgi:hypothetical protein|nr:hypothetical protein [Succinivibrio sp.]